MSVEAWYEGNDMIYRIAPKDAAGLAITGATIGLTMQHTDKTPLTILGGVFTWPLDVPEVGSTGVYQVAIDRAALDIDEGDKVRFVADLDVDAGTEQQWVRVGVVLERTGA